MKASRKEVFVLGVLALGITVLVFLSPHLYPATRYIAQSAGTFSGGIACNGKTAITPATFNGITNSPGDVNYICGTITAPANTEALVVNGGGTSGSPITIYFDSGAVLESPYWPGPGSGGAIDIGSNSYITINGNGGAGGATQGIIEATLNGDSGGACLGGPCQYQADASNGIEASNGASNIIIEGLSIIDMYVTTNPTNAGGGYCTYINGQATNWTITNNLMHDMGWCLQFQYGGTTSNITISNNQIYNIDHGVAMGGPAAGNTLENVYIYGNYIHDYSNWDTSNDSWHHDGVHVWGYNNNGSDTITSVYIYNNKFGGCIGQDVTAHIFIEGNSAGTSNVEIYNNTLIDTCNGNDNDGLINIDDPGYGIYNNTFIGTSGDTCMGVSNATNLTFVNNVASGCGTLIWVDSSGSFASGGLHNNIYADCSGSNCFAYHGNYSGAFSTWQSATGQDASPSEYLSSANLNSSGVPQSGSAVIGNGANLTSLCTGNLAALCSDITGVARPLTGAWTVGAYSNLSTGPQPATGLTGTVAPR